MLTRLRVKGFKNLADFEVHLGPFACIAGANAVGKSNIFDAIRFISLLATSRLDDAARHIRAEVLKNADVKALFTRPAKDDILLLRPMVFEVDVIVPPQSQDDLGRDAETPCTYLTYRISLGYRRDEDERRRRGELELLSEELFSLTREEARNRLCFNFSEEWLNSAVLEHPAQTYLSLAFSEGKAVVKRHSLHQGLSDNLQLAANLPKTFVSAADADSPTLLCVRHELASWELLQLEPTAMRESDELLQKPGISATGAHMPATLYDLLREFERRGNLPQSPSLENLNSPVLTQISNKLHDLLGEIFDVKLIIDDQRELLSLALASEHHVIPARSVSDGTLSFLALVLKQMDSHPQRLICMEEPENGIHPKRIAAMLELLTDTAFDPLLPCGVEQGNPLRQVLLNTHSPAVVQRVPQESLLVAETVPWRDMDGFKRSQLAIASLDGTSRSEKLPKERRATLDSLLHYLADAGADEHPPVGRVIDQTNIRQLLLNL